jgi:hypothetical protein
MEKKQYDEEHDKTAEPVRSISRPVRAVRAISKKATNERKDNDYPNKRMQVCS